MKTFQREIAGRKGLVLAAALLLAGCGKEQSFEALGGGAKSPVSVTIIPNTSGAGGGAAGATAQVAGYGSLKGKVSLSGAAPTLPPLVAESQVKPDDKSVCVVNLIPNQKLVSQNGAVQNVFIYLPKAPAGAKPTPSPAAEMIFDQKTCTFVPHAMIVGAGQEVRIINSDAIAHNVHTYPTRNGAFNNGIGADNKVGIPMKYKLSERSPVKVVCDYHTWMLAWQLPLDHPYGAVTNEAGEFEIKDLPAGKHKFVVWHEGNQLKEVEVTIQPDQEATLDLSFSAADFKLSQREIQQHKTVILSVAH